MLGIACLAGAIPSRRGPVQVWELEVRNIRLEVRFICKWREFVRLGDAAEDV